MTEVSVREAKTQLSKLIARVQAGEEIVITKRGQAVATLRPTTAAQPRQRVPGLLKHWAKYDDVLTRDWTDEEIEEFQPPEDWDLDDPRKQQP